MDGRIYSLKKRIVEKLDYEWTVNEMASGLNLSVPHFQKLFKTHTGMPPITYLRELRLEKARELLETTFLRIKEVGYMSGMKNDSHFTRDFKKKYGLAPTEYRRMFWKVEQL